MHYGYIDFKKFCAARGLTTCEAKTMGLIAFLDRVPSRTFVLDGFPQTKKQAKILFESFGSPHKLFYLEAEKDEVHNRIHTYSSQNRSVSSDALKAEFDEYLKHRDELFAFVKDKHYFHSISTQQSHEAIFRQCRDTFSPTIHFCNKYENKPLCNEYIKKMEKKGFMYLSLEKVIESEIARGLELGRLLNENRSIENTFELIRRLIYAEPAQNKKYIIANFPNDLGFLQRFPEEVCNFSLILHFTKTEGPDPESQLANYSDEFLDVVGNFYTEGKLVGIGLSDPGIVEFHTEKRNKYGIIIGAPTTGKTVIAKALKKSETVKVYLFDKFKEQVIKRLTKDDVTPDDATMVQVLTELNKDLQAAPPNEFFLLDGFSWADANFENLIKICGEPYFVLKLEAPRELLVKRYMAKQGVQELSDEDNDNINKGLAAFQEVAGKVSELLKENSNLKVFGIDISIPEANSIEAVKRCFRKRIILTRVTSRAIDQPKLRNVMAWLCAKFEYQFIDMEAVLEEVARHNPYGIKDPQAILQNIKLRIDSNKKLMSNVLIFNYLQSDLRAGNPESEFYPNSKDEIFYLEQHIGKVRACFNFVNKPENLTVEEKLIPKPEKPVVASL